MQPIITVAVPIFNGERFLAATIQSLLDQSERSFRLLCLDDSSADDSVAVVSSVSDPRIEVIVADEHSSLAENWNRALDMTATRYLVIAHQDDVYEPDFLARMLPLMEGHPRAFAAHCKSAAIDGDGHAVRLPAARYKETFWPSADPYEREPADEIGILSRGNYVIASSVILRMEAVRQIGRFDPSLQFVTDWQYWLRGLNAGFTLAGIHARLVRFRRHPWTATRLTELSLRRYEEEIEVLRQMNARSFRLVENTLTTDFATRLAAGDGDGARSLLEFGDRSIPGFGQGLRRRLLRAAMRGGAAGGHLLQWAERAMVELSVAGHRLTS